MQAPARRHLYVALFGLICVMLLVVLDASNFFTTTDNRLTDKLIVPRTPAKDMVIIAIDDKSIQEFGVWPWPRSFHASMIELLGEAGAKKIGYDVTFSETSSPDEDLALRNAITALDAGTSLTLASEDNVHPLAEFLPKDKSNNSFGNTALQTDTDGVVRSVLVTGSFAATLTESAARESIRIPFIGKPRSFPVYSFADISQRYMVSSARPDPQLERLFKDRIVLVGATAADLHDSALTPTSSGVPMSGVEIQANIIQALREGRSLRTLNIGQRTLIMLALTGFIMALSMTLRLRYLFFSVIGIFVVYLLLVVGLSATDWLLPVTAPALLIALFGGVDVISRYLAEKGQRRFIHAAFAHYLAPAVIEKLVKGETKLELGGIKRELTILFSDIRGFTSLSEKLKPEELVPFLNEYLTAMTDIVLDSEGVVDKYIGDAIMAFWGAPIPQNDHAARSAMTAVKMKRKLAELQTAWSKSGKPRIDIGIGMNTGEVLVGNMGSKQRFDYTVIGDDVNLASRLEGLTKQYGVTALISEATRNKLGDAFMVRELDLVAVKGRIQPVRIFELVEERDSTDGLTLGAIEKFEQALARYRKQDWDGAAQIFDTLSATDRPSAVFLDRIKYLKEHPPETSWDGSFTAKEK